MPGTLWSCTNGCIPFTRYADTPSAIPAPYSSEIQSCPSAIRHGKTSSGARFFEIAYGMIRLELEHDSIAFFHAVAQAGKGTYTSHTGSMMESVLLSVLTPEPGS